jgi:hypothetical protein
MKKNLIIVVVIIAVVGWFIYYIAGLVTKMNIDGKKDAVKTVSYAPEEYLKLFRKDDRLSLDNTAISNTRNPISTFFYDQKFCINIYKIANLNNLPLTEIMVETNVDQHMTYHFTFHVLDRVDNNNIEYKSGTQDKISKIYLNLFGDQIQTIKKNDTLAYYYSNIRNFFIKYQLQGVQDFWGSVNDNHSWRKFPIEIIFLKHHESLYLILMTAKNENIVLIPGTLLRLIKV